MLKPEPRFVRAGYYKKIGGLWHKRCNGCAHDEPTYLPATDKYFYRRKSGRRTNQLTDQCRLCSNWKTIGSRGSEIGYVEVYKVKHFYDEAVNRVGLRELARRTGMTSDGIALVLTGKTRKVRKSNLRKVMLELISIRRKNEHSIGHHAALRVQWRNNGARELCAGCGVRLDQYVERCVTCTERRYKRERRKTGA